MKSVPRTVPFAVVLGLLVSAQSASAQSATVNAASQKQYIRGIGGMSHAAWAGDLTAAERTLAFGNGDGQLGFSALRIPVSDGSPDSLNVATAKAAIASGAIVFATPWNAAGAMDSSQFATYATHLNDFVTYMKNQGVNLYGISVQNEPDYGSQGGWRTWTAAQCHDFILDYGSMITTKLISCESYSYNKSYYDPILDDSAALANVSVLGTHLYGAAVSSYPYPLFDSKGAGKERWMTEHYTDSTTDANSWPNALGVATELHHAMVDGQFDLYTWWFIVRSYGPIYTDGTVSKRGWCMAQFSKFIRPGFYRVDATASPMAGVWVSAYQGPSNLVVVVVNTNNATESLDLSITGSTVSSFTRYTTSGTKSLANDGMVTASNGSVTLSFDAQSVTTLYGAATATVDAGAPMDAGGGGSMDAMSGAVDGGTGASMDAAAAPDTGLGMEDATTDGMNPDSSTTVLDAASATDAPSSIEPGDAMSVGYGSPDAASADGAVSLAAEGGSPSGDGSIDDATGDGSAGGCGCRVAARPSTPAPLAVLGILGAAAIRALRRRRGRRA